MPSNYPDNDFLKEHLKDIRSEMSWRRDLEFKLLQFLLVFYPVIGTGMIALFESDDVAPQIYRIVVAGASMLILAAATFVANRINREHNAYATIAKEVLKIWEYFGLFKKGAYIKDDTIMPISLQDPQSGYGQGQGHKKTLLLVWLVTIAMILILVTLAILKTA
jgi:hypothetical protein